MKLFRIHSNFEKELAKKANEFSLEPDTRVWKGVEAGLRNRASTTGNSSSNLLYLLPALLLFISVAVFLSQPGQPIPDITAADETKPAANRQSVMVYVSSQEKPDFIQVTNTTSRDAFETFTGAVAHPEKMPADSLVAENAEIPVFIVEQNIADTCFTSEVNENILQETTPVNLEIKKPFEGKRFSMDVAATPSIGYRTFTAKNELAQPVASYKNNSDEVLAGWSLRIGMRYHLSEKISVSAGIAYAYTGEKIDLAHADAPTPYDSIVKGHGYDIHDLYKPGQELQYTNRYHFIELPVMVHVTTQLKNKWSLAINGGASYSYLTFSSNKAFHYGIDYYVNASQFTRKHNVNLTAGAALGYALSKGITLTAGPQVKYALFSTFDNAYPALQNQYSIGLSAGVHFQLK